MILKKGVSSASDRNGAPPQTLRAPDLGHVGTVAATLQGLCSFHLNCVHVGTCTWFTVHHGEVLSFIDLVPGMNDRVVPLPFADTTPKRTSVSTHLSRCGVWGQRVNGFYLR